MSYRCGIFFTRKNSFGDIYEDEFNDAECHEDVVGSVTFEAMLHDGYNSNIIKKWLKLLKTIGIKASFTGESIIFHTEESKRYSNDDISSAKQLFAWQMIRLVLNRKDFVVKALKLSEKLTKLNAWDIAYLTWNSNDWENWSGYYDVFPTGEKIKYISITRLLRLINEYNGISILLSHLKSKDLKIDIKSIENKPLIKQFAQRNIYIAKIRMINGKLSIEGFWILKYVNKVIIGNKKAKLIAKRRKKNNLYLNEETVVKLSKKEIDLYNKGKFNDELQRKCEANFSVRKPKKKSA